MKLQKIIFTKNVKMLLRSVDKGKIWCYMFTKIVHKSNTRDVTKLEMKK